MTFDNVALLPHIGSATRSVAPMAGPLPRQYPGLPDQRQTIGPVLVSGQGWGLKGMGSGLELLNLEGQRTRMGSARRRAQVLVNSRWPLNKFTIQDLTPSSLTPVLPDPVLSTIQDLTPSLSIEPPSHIGCYAELSRAESTPKG